MKTQQQIVKIQRALMQKGHIYKISTHQFFSPEQSRMITGYRVTERRSYKKKNGEMSAKEFELFSTYSQTELLIWMAEEWRKLNEER